MINTATSVSAAEVEVPTDLLASLLMEAAHEANRGASQASKVRLKVYGVMGFTTMLTFATLTTCYQLLFAPQVFA